MGERLGPRREFSINWNGKKYNLEWHNTNIFTHDGEDSKYDHIFHIQDDDPDNDGKGLVFFRNGLESFERMIAAMKESGFTEIHHPTVSDGDRRIYNDVHGIQEPTEEPVERPELTPLQIYELTPRLEEQIRKFGDSLLNIPDDLFWDGMEGEHGRPYPERWIED